MYYLHKHGVLDHTFFTVFLRVGGKSGRAEGPALILVVQTVGFPVMRRINHLSELEECDHTSMKGINQGLSLLYSECVPFKKTAHQGSEGSNDCSV